MNKLPKRWRQVGGSYYYQVPKGLESFWDGKTTFLLGKNLPDAYKNWRSHFNCVEDIKTINDLFDRYSFEVLPCKAPTTQRRQKLHIETLRCVFGHMPVDTLLPYHVYQYYEKRSQKIEKIPGKVIGGKQVARGDIAVLSHLYTKAIEWGVINTHPFKGIIRLSKPKPRKRYIEDWEILECFSLQPQYKFEGTKVIQAYMKLRLITGLRSGDTLQLKLSDMHHDGLHVWVHKNKKPVVYNWTEELRSIIDECLESRPNQNSEYFFCNRRGECYYDATRGLASGWDSMWQRFMKRVLKETALAERFTSHDLRAKCASDVESLERARQLLAHSTPEVTQRVYRRKAERIDPANMMALTSQKLFEDQS